MQINKPSKDAMQTIFKLWEKEVKFENYAYEEKALGWLFKAYPSNDDLNVIISKPLA